MNLDNDFSHTSCALDIAPQVQPVVVVAAANGEVAVDGVVHLTQVSGPPFESQSQAVPPSGRQSVQRVQTCTADTRVCFCLFV